MSSRGLLEPGHFSYVCVVVVINTGTFFPVLRACVLRRETGDGVLFKSIVSNSLWYEYNDQSSRNKKLSTIEAASKANWKVILRALSRKEFEGLQPQCFGTGMQSRCTIGRRSGPLLEAKHIKPSN